jgi:hypothetical protein
MGGSGELISKECIYPLRSAFLCNEPAVATTISGIDSMEALDQNLAILRDFQPLSTEQMQTLRNSGKQFEDGRYELYKRTEVRQRSWPHQHGYPSSAELPV